MVGKYAQNTEVSVNRSRAELETTIKRFGASKFAFGWDEHGASIQFEVQGRRIRFFLPLPSPDDERFVFTDSGNTRSAAAASALREKDVRRRWRALNLVVKAKLAAVEDDISTFEDEFLAFFVTPSGATVGDILRPQLDRALATGNLPPLLPGPKEATS